MHSQALSRSTRTLDGEVGFLQPRHPQLAQLRHIAADPRFIGRQACAIVARNLGHSARVGIVGRGVCAIAGASHIARPTPKSGETYHFGNRKT